MYTFVDIFQPLSTAQFLLATILGILFIQSGLDKVFDRKGNLDWLNGYFEKTFMKGMVPMLVSIITLMEIAAGLLSAAGAIQFLFSGSTQLAVIGAQVAALNITMLFFGMRIAKDYEGAANMVGYFLLSIAAIYLLQV